MPPIHQPRHDPSGNRGTCCSPVSFNMITTQALHNRHLPPFLLPPYRAQPTKLTSLHLQERTHICLRTQALRYLPTPNLTKIFSGAPFQFQAVELPWFTYLHIQQNVLQVLLGSAHGSYNPMPEPPPEVKTYRGLAEFQSLYADTVIVAIDLEGIDHRNGIHANGLEIWEKVSEVGASFFDPRDVRLDSGSPSATTCSPKQSPLNTSTERLSSIVKYIITYHAIINRWRQWTEETCDAPHHKTHDKAHTAKPYHCMVTESCFRTHEGALSDLDRLLRDLSIRNLTAEEIETGKRRMVQIIYWDARMESTRFHDIDFDVGWYGAIAWGFQQFKPFRSRNEKARTGAEKAFDSLGALGTGAGGMAVLHIRQVFKTDRLTSGRATSQG
ncbi:hypothetical protein B0H65DRAFT_541739 [Neurospora tetraspora]|uniref:Uncharacterized protein n=1 Tax=Neurospora tetraspora TaxID=94610 RepID=A0AAE0J8D2_9PEZI|nr:hypothetical protein B0H65DRAFT_541739 [Neurospora tetraspora]